MNSLELLRFDIERSARYHERRQASLEFRHNFTLVLTVVLGSASAAAFLAKTDWSYIPALILTILTTIDLVMGTTGQIRAHANLRQKFLLLRVECMGGCADDEIDELERKKALIDAEEPPVHETVNVEAHNDTARAHDVMLYKIPWWLSIPGRFFRLRMTGAAKLEPSFQPDISPSSRAN